MLTHWQGANAVKFFFFFLYLYSCSKYYPYLKKACLILLIVFSKNNRLNLSIQKFHYKDKCSVMWNYQLVTNFQSWWWCISRHLLFHQLSCFSSKLTSSPIDRGAIRPHCHPNSPWCICLFEFPTCSRSPTLLWILHIVFFMHSIWAIQSHVWRET